MKYQTFKGRKSETAIPRYTGLSRKQAKLQEDRDTKFKKACFRYFSIHLLFKEVYCLFRFLFLTIYIKTLNIFELMMDTETSETCFLNSNAVSSF